MKRLRIFDCARQICFGLMTLSLLTSAQPVRAEDYSFDIPTKEEQAAPALQWGGNLDVNYTLLNPRESSPIYALQFSDDERDGELLTQYLLDAYLNADYQTKQMGFHLKTHAAYWKDADDLTLDLFELYGNLNLSLSSSLQAGKIRYNWGKGYAFNPVGFVNSLKNPEDPSKERAGILSLQFETIKSLQSDVLKTVALNALVIPDQSEEADSLGEADKTAIAAKLYLMLWNLDVEMMGRYGKDQPPQIGADMAVNLTTALEVHAEAAYAQDVTTYTVEQQKLTKSEEDGFSGLIGLRWLNRWEITTIFEYYHTDLGLTEEEFTDYLDAIEQSANSGQEEQIRNAAGLMQNFKVNNLMQDYLYLNLQKPEPFDWLYFTPSAFVIYNLQDQSALIALNLSYKPITNIELQLKPMAMVGADDSEYGSQRFQQKIEAWVRFYF